MSITLPQSLFIGDNWVFKYSSVDASKNLKVHIVSPQFTYVSNLGTFLNNEYIFNISSSITQNFIAGIYQFSISETLATERNIIFSGSVVKVLPDPTATASFSYAQRMVSSLEALLEGRVTSSQALYSSLTFEGRSITQLSPAEIHTALKLFKQELEAERHADAIAKGMGNRRKKIKVRFK